MIFRINCFPLIISFFVAFPILLRAEVIPTSVEQYDVFETTLHLKEPLNNPFVEARLDAKFTGPDRKTYQVAGFYTGENEWKVRFSPGKQGKWKFSATLKGKTQKTLSKGSFSCVPGAS